MSKPVITVEGLSKAYRIGLKEEVPDTLMSAVTGFMKAPLKKFHELRKLDTFRHSGDSEDIYWALKDVSFEVQEGEVLGVIGRNGAGKSTLLKILSRITEPTSGRAVIRGRVSSLLEVGTGFHPELSGRENVYLNGTILGMTKREVDSKFDAIVDFSGVEKFLDTPIKRYSSGMKVRLAFAVAAHLEPEILIIDEVLAVGDAEFQKKCMGKMQDVAKGGRTVLFVSHNMGAVEQLCSTAMLLQSGRLVPYEDKRAVIDSYLEAFVAKAGPGGALYSVDPLDTSTHRVIRELKFAIDSGFQHGRPLCFGWKIDVADKYDALYLVVGFAKPNGSRVLTVEWPLIVGDRVGQLDAQTTIVDLPLAPGNYHLDIAVRAPTSSSLDYVKDACRIAVLAGPKTPPHLLDRTGSSDGDVRMFLTEAICNG